MLTVVPGLHGLSAGALLSAHPHTNEPAVVLRESGKGRLAYFPGDIERTMWLRANRPQPSARRTQFAGSLGQLRGQRRGQGLIEVFAWETEPGFAVHVLNYTNPNAHRRLGSRVLPHRRAESALQTAPGPASHARRTAARRAATFPSSHRRSVEFTIPSVEDYEVAALYSNS